LEDPTDVRMRPFNPNSQFEAENNGGRHHDERV
jgi:hypothetical protein